MKLLDQIIEGAGDDDQAIGAVLRKCLTLAYTLKNDELKTWVLAELNGFEENEDVPIHRRFKGVSKGLFLGGLGSSISDQPLALHILEPEHRKHIENCDLRQPIGAYAINMEEVAKGKGGFRFDWPPGITAMYQSKFIRGYALNRAYIELPPSVIVGMLETVRTKVLQFALEIRQELGTAATTEAVENLPPEKVTSIVNMFITGGQNVIHSTARDIQQVGSVTIEKGNFVSLGAALDSAGVSQPDIKELEQAVEADKEAGATGIGAKVTGWIGRVAAGSLKVSADVAKVILTSYVAQYLGLPPAG